MKDRVYLFGYGLLFGFGLIVAQMTNPAKVLAFLDVAGAWDPSLALVMIGALATLGGRATGCIAITALPITSWNYRSGLGSRIK